MESWRRVPEVATPRTVSQAFGVFYSAGGAAALLVAAGLGSGAGPARALVAAAGVLGLLTGVSVWRVRERFPLRAAHALVLVGNALISAAVVVAPGTASAVALASVYTFLAVDVFVFFSIRAALGHLAVCVLAATAALTTHDDLGLADALALDVVLVAIAVVVGVLARTASSASLDTLTGLPNRRGLDEALDRLARAAERSGSPLSVALLDLDGFKAVNDAGGHEAGDRVLRATVASWRSALPEAAVLGRTGGDEFAVLLPGASPAELALVLSSLVRDPDRPASAGVAGWSPPESPADALRRADGALYLAKKNGRQRCELAALDAPAESLAADLLLAVRSGDVAVHYQPVVTTQGRLNGVEALARWTHPVRGVVPPDVFVRLAETGGFVGELGAAVLERACRDLAGLPGARGLPLRLAVNVSGLELVEPGYAHRLADVLARTGWPAELLVLEVTESVVEGDAPRAVAALEAVAALGVRVAVDDFGTGYSALSRLDQLGAAYLKLDATFTATVHTSPQRAQLVRAVTLMSRTLGLGVVAEGVETAGQARLLTDLGCDYLQGYHLGRPEPLAALAARVTPRAPEPAPGRDLPAPRRGDAAEAHAGSRRRAAGG